MTDQRKRFAERYIETLNGKESAIYAGYSEATATQQAWELLQIEEVQEYLQEKRKEFALKTGISIERVLNEYKKIAFSDIREICTVDGGMKQLSDLDDDAAGAISSIKSFEVHSLEGEKLGTNREIKLHDKIRALEALGKHLGLFEADNSQKSKEVVIFELPSNGRSKTD